MILSTIRYVSSWTMLIFCLLFYRTSCVKNLSTVKSNFLFTSHSPLHDSPVPHVMKLKHTENWKQDNSQSALRIWMLKHFSVLIKSWTWKALFTVMRFSVLNIAISTVVTTEACCEDCCDRKSFFNVLHKKIENLVLFVLLKFSSPCPFIFIALQLM